MGTTRAAGSTAVTTLRGARRGPTLALLGGVHGDEDEGVLAVKRVLHELAEAPLAGTVRAVAPANPPAWAAHARTNPLDNQDLARCFPGDVDAGPTAALAAGLTSDVIAGSDLLIDLHSAGTRYSMPLFCGFSRDNVTAQASLRAALAFGAPIIWVNLSAPGRSMSAAEERGIPSIYAECSGGGGVRQRELDAYVRGVFGVMADLGMLPESFASTARHQPQRVYSSGDLDDGAKSDYDGLFVTSSEAGDVVPDGSEIGRMYDYEGRLLDVVRAPSHGMVMFLRRQSRTQRGDVLFVMARLEDDQE